MLNLLLACATLAPQGPSTAPVVINEFSYDDAGTDNFEFVELYNRSNAPVDISGWSIVNADPGSPRYGGTGVDPTWVVPAATILAPGAFYVIGNAAVVNVNLVCPANMLENDNESIELYDATNTLIDAVCYEMGRGAFGIFPNEGNGFYGDLAVGDGVGMPTASISRWLDGYDFDDNGHDFNVAAVPTPGTTNNSSGSALPYNDNFDLGVTGTPVNGWNRGFVYPKYVDPTVLSSENLSVKPASPAGGLAMSTWDSSGGGNSVQLANSFSADVVVESYVWLEPLMTPFNPAPYTPSLPPVILNTYNYADGEFWAMGVRGSIAANGNPPDAAGDYYTITNPGVGFRPAQITGIAWCQYRTPNYSRLYLVDFGNGAAPANPNNFTILAGPIDIQAGVNDGWQRIRLHVQGNKVIANFGGTYGMDNGQRYSTTTTTTAPGAVYIGYREAILYNNNGTAGCRPPLFDLFTAHVPTTAQTFVGSGSPTSVGTPSIDSDGYAILGSTGFAFTGTNMVPLGNPNGAFCGLVFGFGTFAPGFPIPGAQPAALGHVLPILGSTIGFATPTGTVRFPFGIPANVSYLGISIATQLVDFDTSLPYAAPIGTSRAMASTVGQ